MTTAFLKSQGFFFGNRGLPRAPVCLDPGFEVLVLALTGVGLCPSWSITSSAAQFLLCTKDHLWVDPLGPLPIFLFLKLFSGARSFPGGSDGKESACNAGDPGLIPRSGRSLGEGNGNPRYSCLENSVDTRAWHATVHQVAKSWTCLSD